MSFFSSSFKIYGTFQGKSQWDFVALVVSNSEAKWPTATKMMQYSLSDMFEQSLHYCSPIKSGKKILGANPCPRSVGGTFMENLSVGDQVAIVQHGKGSKFVYPRDGGSALTFRGELIAETNLPPVILGS